MRGKNTYNKMIMKTKYYLNKENQKVIKGT